MRVKVKRLLVASVFSICLVGFVRADLAKRVNACLNRPLQKKTRFSIHIVKADSGKIVYGHNANRALVPASNMKIIVTAAALKYLGSNYEYKTRVGLWDNTLVITGSGDPLLGDKVIDAKYGRKKDWIFEDITSQLKRKSITHIKDIIVDTSVFDDQRVHPNWPVEQLNFWYACEVSGLNFNDNCIDVTAKNVGGRVAVSVEPETSYVKITNKVTAIQKGGGAVGSFRQPGKPNQIIVRGKCRKEQGPFAVAIERPAAFFGYLLAEKLVEAGINTDGQLIEKELGRVRDFKLLAEYRSSMADCLARCNKDSLQLAAEALLKTIASNSMPDKKNGSWVQGRQVISQYLSGLGIENDKFYIDDGSGLSRQNKLSANAITTVLLDAYKSRNWRFYRDSLAIGGVDGTIGKYFKEQKYRGKIFGKTGYINSVRSFSGVCSTVEGDYIFSILANNANGRTRKVINDITKAIIDDAEGPN
ncbi:MAG: D-alanyl-D-alanine carboxypeptidase/D-alanyl-D-alanine endopeptidase [Planctomycetota bacterium]|jgi:D-alanyl-D-alanine carboxypeptidase/D-alanyl-D-alanine-endopeptidase (penicillin-binding protein 4)